MKNTEKILLLGPSGKIKNLSEDKLMKYKEEGFSVFSYTDSIFHLKEIGVPPDYFSFLDPYTIGRKIDFYETDKFVSNTNLIMFDLYGDNLKNFYDFGFTCNSFIRVYRHLYDRFVSFNFEKNFKSAIKINSKCVNITDEKFKDSVFDYKEDSYIFSSFGSINVDKFSCMIIPLIVNYFSDLKEIRCIGFGDFSVGRFYNNRSNGYEEFIKNFHTMKKHILHNLRKYDIKISFEQDNYFNKELNK